MANRNLFIEHHLIPETFHGLVGNMPHSQVVREVSCDCHEVDSGWQRNWPGHCLPHAFSQGSQKPKWLVISCMDSRFPIESTLGVGAHQICSIRVAGGQLKDYRPDSEAWHSINLALQHFKTIEGIAIIGHSACGASGDLMAHFSNAAQQNSGMLSRHVSAFYTPEDRDRAEQATKIIDADGGAGRYLSYDFRHTARTKVNAATLLGLAKTEQAISAHLDCMGIHLNVCTMMISIDPHHHATPMALLVRQPDATWQNALGGQQPNIPDNMDACPRDDRNSSDGKRIIPITPIACGG